MSEKRKRFRYICFFQFTPKWHNLSKEEKSKSIERIKELQKKHGIEYLFGGDAWGVPEREVHIFESEKFIDNFGKFLDEMNPDYIDYTRTIIVT